MKTWFVGFEFEDEFGRVYKGSDFFNAPDVNGLRAQINAMKFDHARNHDGASKELIITIVTLI
ncbi:hypothetical protein CBF16_14435 [Pantoea agglomerans]|jgi:hypothetical protein|uniref:hypothetical protein n=1 Tax=Enterobacter agglomerans TaxID=549 RepID=UPI000F5E9E4F|nr:hypothetical protein [Pantoea agglomerans]AZI51992.1 hypothetical protein CBF16_14435 [Pantoea agglomerans]